MKEHVRTVQRGEFVTSDRLQDTKWSILNLVKKILTEVSKAATMGNKVY